MSMFTVTLCPVRVLSTVLPLFPSCVMFVCSAVVCFVCVPGFVASPSSPPVPLENARQESIVRYSRAPRLAMPGAVRRPQPGRHHHSPARANMGKSSARCSTSEVRRALHPYNQYGHRRARRAGLTPMRRPPRPQRALTPLGARPWIDPGSPFVRSFVRLLLFQLQTRGLFSAQVPTPRIRKRRRH